MQGEREITVETYNKSAAAMAEFFRGIGSRVQDIETAFRLAGNPQEPNVLEIGCGDGRDALEITRLTDRYIGFDISDAMINLAREHVPGAQFYVGDAVDFPYPSETDIIFAFASLLHLDRDEVQQVFKTAADSLKKGGLFFISLKYASEYQRLVQEDRFGKRIFYLYNQQIIDELAGDSFQTVYAAKSVKGSTEWLETGLQKR